MQPYRQNRSLTYTRIKTKRTKNSEEEVSKKEKNLRKRRGAFMSFTLMLLIIRNIKGRKR